MSDQTIIVEELSRRFGSKAALNRVSFTLSAGTVMGLVGENGAGKTTLIKHLLGLYRPQSGTVRVFDRDPARDSVQVLQEIGYLSEERDLPDWMRIAELMSYQRAFYANWDQAFADELCEMFQLSKKQRVSSLSRGQRARVGMLVALAHRPALLVLDEPSSGLDPVVRSEILMAIVRTVADEGRNVLFSSHLLDEVQRVADRVAMLHAGAHDDRQLVGRHLEFPSSIDSSILGATGRGSEIVRRLAWSGEGREWAAICNGQLEQLRKAAIEAGAEVVDEDVVTLNEVFVARTSAATQARENS